MCTSSKEKKSAQTAAEQAINAQMEAAKLKQSTAEQAKADIEAAGKATPDETQRMARYTTKATTPAEQLMTEAGPISQAVSQRILERTQNPGMDFDTASKNWADYIGTPVWRSIKQRGIAAPPGSEGGGLGTEQYMTQVAPALTQARSNQINTDITNAQNYGNVANALQQYYGTQESNLSEAIRQRLIDTIQSGSAYGYQGASDYGTGLTNAADINQKEVVSRYTQKDEQNAQLGKMIGLALAGAGTGFLAAPALAGLGIGTMASTGIGALGGASAGLGGGGSSANALQIAQLLKQPTTTASTPASNQLNYRINANTAKNYGYDVL